MALFVQLNTEAACLQGIREIKDLIKEQETELPL